MLRLGPRERPTMGVAPARGGAQGEQSAHGLRDRGDRGIRIFEMFASQLGRAVRDQHRSTVAAAIAVVGHEAEHGGAVDESAVEIGRPPALSPAEGDGDRRRPLAALRQPGGDHAARGQQSPGLRVGHGEHRRRVRSEVDLVDRMLQLDVHPLRQIDHQRPQPTGCRVAQRPGLGHQRMPGVGHRERVGPGAGESAIQPAPHDRTERRGEIGGEEGRPEVDRALLDASARHPAAHDASALDDAGVHPGRGQRVGAGQPRDAGTDDQNGPGLSRVRHSHSLSSCC